MAEAAPLTAALAHARQAAQEISHARWEEAAAEHRHAASSYSRAARTTSDSEALRVLRLLEIEHSKLATLLKTKDNPEHSTPSSTDARPSDPKTAASTSSKADVTLPISAATSSSVKQTSALRAPRFGSQTRDASPSLARDMASRRGIPPSARPAPSAAAQARARPTSPEAHRRAPSGVAARIPPSVMHSQSLQHVARTPKPSEDDDAFAKFYSNLTTGTMSRLSSALAYAGLPLTADDIPPEQPRQKLDRSTVSAHVEPDVKNIFSKAALTAIEDDHRQRGIQGRAFGPAESFYVVQTGGGTYSYADVAKSSQQKETVDEDEEEVFVDARDAREPPSPKHSRMASQNGGREGFGTSRTSEELELENVTLKQTLEQLATRLAEFETHAQDASMAALTQSMASLNHVHAGIGDSNAADKIRQLELQLAQITEDRQKYYALANKQDKVLKQYKAKWEDIKKSAREKDRTKREKGDKPADDAVVSANEPWKAGA